MAKTELIMKFLTAISVLVASALARGNKVGFFQRVGVFPVCSQIDSSCDTDNETLAEIVVASNDGNTLIYTDSATGAAGFVDITDPSNPLPLGVFATGGVPTSVAVVGEFALVVVNESDDFVNTAGSIKVINIATQSLITSIDLGGQPDSIVVSPDGAYAVVCIENERDEDVNDGALPQLPAGFVVVVDLDGPPETWTTSEIALTGLPNILYPSDPEPEFASINTDNIAAVTLQENNGVVLIDLVSKSIIDSIDAGLVSLHKVDATVDGVILQTEIILDIPREPDGCVWITNRYLATADEGDLDGGSRGFTIFDSNDGSVVYSSGNTIERLAAAIGHYPESRSEKRATSLNMSRMEFSRVMSCSSSMPRIPMRSLCSTFPSLLSQSTCRYVDFISIMDRGRFIALSQRPISVFRFFQREQAQKVERLLQNATCLWSHPRWIVAMTIFALPSAFTSTDSKVRHILLSNHKTVPTEVPLLGQHFLDLRLKFVVLPGGSPRAKRQAVPPKGKSMVKKQAAKVKRQAVPPRGNSREKRQAAPPGGN